MELPSQRVAEILAAIDQPRPAPSGAEQRRMPRTEQHASVLVTAWPAPRNEHGTGLHAGLASVTVRNCSSHGIAILHSRAMRRGDQFVVRLLNDGRETAAILCTVAHCRRVNALFHAVGAEFTRLLNHGEIPPSAPLAEVPQPLSA